MSGIKMSWLPVLAILASALCLPLLAGAQDDEVAGGDDTGDESVGGFGGESGSSAPSTGASDAKGGSSGTEYGYDDSEGEEGEYGPIDEGLRIRDDGKQGSQVLKAYKERKSVVIGGAPSRTLGTLPETTQPDLYTVKVGDTLWDVCDRLLGDAYVWPKIWSYNPKITNPHWIYPGDQVRLAMPEEELARPLALGDAAASDALGTAGLPNLISGGQVAGKMKNFVMFLGNKGFVDEQLLKESGYISGSFKEALLLTQYDEAYVKFEGNQEIHIGDQFGIYRFLDEVEPIRDIDADLGYLVEVVGHIRVITFDARTRIARAIITEALHPIERDMKVGIVKQKYELAPPARNKVDLTGNLIAFMDQTVLSTEMRIVFVDLGKADGVEEGNRMFIVEKRDLYQKSIEEDDKDEGYPTEVIAEIRVVEARPHTSTCLVTRTIRELEIGNRVEMRKGY